MKGLLSVYPFRLYILRNRFTYVLRSMATIKNTNSNWSKQTPKKRKDFWGLGAQRGVGGWFGEWRTMESINQMARVLDRRLTLHWLITACKKINDRRTNRELKSKSKIYLSSHTGTLGI